MNRFRRDGDGDGLRAGREQQLDIDDAAAEIDDPGFLPGPPQGGVVFRQAARRVGAGDGCAAPAVEGAVGDGAAVAGGIGEPRPGRRDHARADLVLQGGGGDATPRCAKRRLLLRQGRDSGERGEQQAGAARRAHAAIPRQRLIISALLLRRGRH